MESTKDDFIWLLATAILILLIPFSVSLSIKGKEIRKGRAQIVYPICGNNICELGESDNVICPDCNPGQPCPLRACDIYPGSCSSDCQTADKCVQSGGFWKEFPDSCVDNCARVIYLYPEIACLQVITEGCDCGPGRCWSGLECVPEPWPFPTKTISPVPTIKITPIITPLVTFKPTMTVTPFPTFIKPTITVSPCKITPPPFRVGDSDGDGDVDGFDYVIWFRNFGRQTSLAAREGDFNFDCRVDGFDFVLWWQNFGR